jgi:hypothetical protein
VVASGGSGAGAGAESGDSGEAFSEVVIAEFGFLVERGFRPVVVQADGEVRFVAAHGVFVRVFHDPRERHVGFRVGLSSCPKDALAMEEYARLTGAKRHGEYLEGVPRVRASARNLARLLRDHGDGVLAGDEEIYERVKGLRHEYTKSFARRQPQEE